MLTRILSFAALAVSRLFSQFKSSLEAVGLLRALGTEVQALDDAIVDTKEATRDPSVAAGVTLDNVGRIVGAPPRGSLTDVEYRLRIFAQIETNASEGRSSDMLAISKALIAGWDGADVAQIVESNGTAVHLGAFVITPSPGLNLSARITPAQAEELLRFLTAGVASGNRPIVVFRDPSIALNQAFRFSGGSPPETAVGFGVGKLYDSRDSNK